MSWEDVGRSGARRKFSEVLGRQRPVFAQLFHAALTAGQLADAALLRADELYGAIPPLDDVDDGKWRAWNDMSTFASTQAEARDIYAEVLVASIVRLVSSLKRQLGVQKMPAGIELNGVPISELFRCARNNFAHRDEWVDPKLSSRERRDRDQNTSLLQQAGIANPTGSDVCYEALRLIGAVQYLALEEVLEGMASEYFGKAGGRLEP